MLSKKPVNIETALKIYYENFEIGNKEIKTLFGSISTATIAKMKNAVYDEMLKRGILRYSYYGVNTEVAYEVWGIDVEDLERRRKKLQRLNLV